MQLPKGLWFVSVLAFPGDLLRLVYVTRDILARVHCFDVCVRFCIMSRLPPALKSFSLSSLVLRKFLLHL